MRPGQIEDTFGNLFGWDIYHGDQTMGLRRVFDDGQLTLPTMVARIITMTAARSRVYVVNIVDSGRCLSFERVYKSVVGTQRRIPKRYRTTSNHCECWNCDELSCVRILNFTRVKKWSDR
jgi:hypothetical protein